MQIIVDRDRCEGHGLCEEAAPEVFSLDDDGELVLLTESVPAELHASTERAVRLCPVAALALRS